jgi:hypothetical protein
LHDFCLRGQAGEVVPAGLGTGSRYGQGARRPGAGGLSASGRTKSSGFSYRKPGGWEGNNPSRASFADASD